MPVVTELFNIEINDYDAKKSNHLNSFGVSGTRCPCILFVCRFEEMLGKATQILDSSHEDKKTPVRVPDRRKLQLGEVKVEPHTDTNDTCDTPIQVCIDHMRLRQVRIRLSD